MSVPDEVMKLKDGKIIVDKLKSMVATQFVEATANDAGAYVVYQGQVYYLPDGHTANTTWANTTKVGPTNIGEQLAGVKNAIDGVEDDVVDLDLRVAILEGNVDYELIETDTNTSFTKTVPAEASKAEIESTGTKSIVYNQHFPAVNTTQNDLQYSTDESTGWVTVTGTSSGNSGFRPSGSDVIPLGHKAACIIETDGIELKTSLSAGFELFISGGPGYTDGSVKGEKTESFIFSTNNYTWGISFRCGTGNIINGKIRVQLFDLTVMFGEGNEPSTLSDFLAIFTGDYYAPDAIGTTVTVSCDKILLNGEEQSESSFNVNEDDVITIHTSSSVGEVLIPVSSTVNYYKAVPKSSKPEYAAESEKVATDLLNENADLRIMLFTDNHDYTPFKYEKYADMMDHGIVDYLVGLGDYKDYGVTHDKIWYKTNLLNALTKAGRNANCLYVVGNHDVGIKGVQGAPNSVDYLLTPVECFDVLNRHYSKNPAIVYDEDNPFGGWYYLDDEKSKIRMIVLQSSDIFKSDGSFVRYKDELMFMSQGQLTWFCEKACKLNKADTTGWGIIVFMHNDKPYGTENFSLFKILQAVKNGTTYTETFTVYNRMTLVDGNWTTTRDQVNGDTIEIDCDYTSQGAIDVLGVIHGHGHVDEAATYANVNDIQVRCDNGFLDDYYIAPVEGITAGTYWFTDIDGKKWAITYSSSYNDVAYIGYNYYFSHNNVSPMPISRYDSNMNRIRSNSGCSLIDEIPAGATEVTGFVSERGTSRIGQESAEILCIDKVNKTLTFIPYGTATKRIVSY